MTQKQHRWYLREWSAAFAAHWCGSRGGEALVRPGRPISRFRDEVVVTARKLSMRMEDGRLSADLLRKACHVLAIGRSVSSLELTNKQLDLVVAVFRRLAEDGAELNGQMRIDKRAREIARQDSAAEQEAADGKAAPWTATQPDADRKRVTWSIEHSGYPVEALRTICRDRFGTSEWRTLTDRDLYLLMITIKSRAAVHADRQQNLRSTTQRAAPASVPAQSCA